MGKEERGVSLQFNTDMELEEKNRAPSPTPALEYKVDESPDEIFEDKNYIKDH